jgi:lipoate-protein ligase A
VGEIDVRMFVEKGYLTELKIFGDFFGKEPLEDIENLLTGVKYDKEQISQKLKGIIIEEYFGDVPKSEFIELLYGSDEEDI